MPRFKRVLLVCPKFYTGRNRLTHTPLVGLGYIAEALKNAGLSVSVFNMNLNYKPNELSRRINYFKPDLIGFTAMTLGYKKFYQLVEQTKLLYPEIKIVLGGAHISAVKEQALAECAGIDYGLILEADRSIVQLCQGEDLAKIPGLLFRKEGLISINKFQDFITDLDALPFPKYEGFDLDKYPLKQIAILTSRGCPYECIYCSTNATIGRKFRARSPESIIAEIIYWHQRGYREILIIDDNFTLIYQRAEKVCALLEDAKLDGLHLKITSGIRGDRVDRGLLSAMRKVGVDYIAFGVESASDKVLKNIKKGEDIATIEKSIRQACELGFAVDLFFLVGSPGESLSDLKESFALARRYPVRRAVFYNLLPLPATELLEWINQKGYLARPIEEVLNNTSYYKNQPAFYTPEMPLALRKKAFRMAQAVSLAVRRNYIESNIKGPVFLKKIFSRVYALPQVEDMVNNNRLVLFLKEKIKEAFL